MKKLIRITTHIFALALIIASTSCDVLNLKDDPCDDSVATEIAVEILVKVQDNINSDLTEVTLDIYKVPCGAAKKGEFHFSGFTVKGDYMQSYKVGYNLRNKNDIIKVEVKGQNPFAKKVLSETFQYTYDDFTNSKFKQPLVYFEFLE